MLKMAVIVRQLLSAQGKWRDYVGMAMGTLEPADK